MFAFIVEIETPSGRRVLKGTLAPSEKHAVAGIRQLQRETNRNGVPRCVRGEIVDVWKREPGRPIPQGLLKNPEAIKILSHFQLA